MAEHLRLAAPEDHLTALVTALGAGIPMVPLPEDRDEAAAVEAMASPELPLEDPEAVVVLPTSGSTGSPKGVLLTTSAITASATATHERLGGVGHWHLALPTHHIAGLMVLARAIHAGNDPILTRSDLSRLKPVREERNYLSIVPTQLHRALGQPAIIERLAQFDAVLVGGQRIDENVLARARAHDISVVTTYGMSETCGGCVYDGEPLRGVDPAIDEHGQITIAGPMLFRGYRGRSDLTRAALVEGRFQTQDRGTFENGRLRVSGRADSVVITGGVNVDLASVEERAARAVPDGTIVILGLPDAEWGVRIVAATNSVVDLTTLRKRLSDLPKVSLPRELARVDPLPETGPGKVDRMWLTENWPELDTEVVAS